MSFDDSSIVIPPTVCHSPTAGASFRRQFFHSMTAGLSFRRQSSPIDFADNPAHSSSSSAAPPPPFLDVGIPRHRVEILQLRVGIPLHRLLAVRRLQTEKWIRNRRRGVQVHAPSRDRRNNPELRGDFTGQRGTDEMTVSKTRFPPFHSFFTRIHLISQETRQSPCPSLTPSRIRTRLSPI